MASTKVTFVTGTAEVKRRDINQSYASHPEQRLTSEPHTPQQVSFIDGKCTCCPYGYHIDLDFLNFCRDMESGSTLRNLKRIQKAKRKLRKSMEVMLDEHGGMVIPADPTSMPPDVVHSSEAGRLMHMVNYERSATHRILNQIDSSVNTTLGRLEGGRGQRYMSSDSDETNSPATPMRPMNFHDESGLTPSSFTSGGRTDSLTSLSSESTVSSDNPMVGAQTLQFQQQQLQQLHRTVTHRTTTKVIENPVIEMGTAEMKPMEEMDYAKEVPVMTLPMMTPPTQSQPPLRESPDINQMSLQSVREAMSSSLQRLRELEEQVKALPILQVRISVLKEEKRLLNLQLKASKAQSRSEAQMVSVGVGSHSVIEPYLLQPDLPTGYTTRENVSHTEFFSTSLEMSKLTALSTPSLNMSFRNPSSVEDHRPASTTPHSGENMSPRFTINQIQKTTPKPLTRSIGTGDCNVFDNSGLQIHEKEMRTVIIGQGGPVAKRNVGIECRVPTRDVGVSFMCDEEKPQTRTIGVNVNYDTSGLVTAFDFKGETELRMALKGVLQRNVHTKATNCNFRPQTSEKSVSTDFGSGVSVGCGDETHNINVEIRAPVTKKTIGVTAKPETAVKYVSTEKGWVLDAGTNTVVTDKYNKTTMTDRLRQSFVATNTEPVVTRPASNQTDQKVFVSSNQIKHTGSNTQKATSYSVGTSPDALLTRTLGVNTTESVKSLFEESGKRTEVNPYTIVSPVVKKTHTVEEKIIERGASQANALLKQTDLTDTERNQSVSNSDSVTSSTSTELMTKRSVSETNQKNQLKKPVGDGKASSEEDSFSETITEHYVITKGGKKLISQEKDKTIKSGGKTKNTKSTIYGPAATHLSNNVSDLSSSGDSNAMSLESQNTSAMNIASQNMSAMNVASHDTSTFGLASHDTSTIGLASQNTRAMNMSPQNTNGMGLSSQEHFQSSYRSGLSSIDDSLTGSHHSGSVRGVSRSSSFGGRGYGDRGYGDRGYGDSDRRSRSGLSSRSLEGRTSRVVSSSRSSHQAALSRAGLSPVSSSTIVTGTRLIDGERGGMSGGGDMSSYSSSFSSGNSLSSGLSSNLQSDSMFSDGAQTNNVSSSSSSSSTTIVTNPYRTVENLAAASSSVLEGSKDSQDGASKSKSGFRHVSKTSSEGNLFQRSSASSSYKPRLDHVKSMETVYDMRRVGSVEDFMPDDVRKYMSIDPSNSKDSGFGEDLQQKFSEQTSSSSSSTSSSSPAGGATEEGKGGMKSVRLTRTVTTRRTTKKGNEVSVEETKTVEGPDGKKTTKSTKTLGDEDQSLSSAGAAGQECISQQQEGMSKAMGSMLSSSSSFSSSSHSSGESGSNLSSSSFTSNVRSHSAGDRMCVSESADSSVSNQESDGKDESRLYGSLDRKTGLLKSIMKQEKSEKDSYGKKGITFAESVIGGTSSSAEEEHSSESEDSDGSFEEGSYHSEQGEVIFQCEDDQAIAEGVPGAQMFDQNIRETYELSSEVRESCSVLANFLMDSTTIQTKELNASTEQVQAEWFRVSSHKLSDCHQVEDFLSSVNEISRRLLQHIINMVDANGNTAIHYCVSHCNFDIANLLMDSEVCDIDQRNKAGYTPIMLTGLVSVQNLHHQEIIRRIFSLGDINARASSTDQTALMLASTHGRTEMVRLLVEAGADFNMADEDGSTALMCACEHGHLEIVSFLLSQPNINAEAVDNEGSTALNIAMEAGHKDVGVIMYKHLNFSKSSFSSTTTVSQKKKKTSSGSSSHFSSLGFR